MHEGLRPYWYDSSIFNNRSQFKMRFYYPADINSIMILDKTTGTEHIVFVKQEGKYLYIRKDSNGGISRKSFNNGNTVIYDQRQEKPVYSNRISKR